MLDFLTFSASPAWAERAPLTAPPRVDSGLRAKGRRRRIYGRSEISSPNSSLNSTLWIQVPTPHPYLGQDLPSPTCPNHTCSGPSLPTGQISCHLLHMRKWQLLSLQLSYGNPWNQPCFLSFLVLLIQSTQVSHHLSSKICPSDLTPSHHCTLYPSPGHHPIFTWITAPASTWSFCFWPIHLFFWGETWVMSLLCPPLSHGFSLTHRAKVLAIAHRSLCHPAFPILVRPQPNPLPSQLHWLLGPQTQKAPFFLYLKDSSHHPWIVTRLTPSSLLYLCSHVAS